MVVVVDFSVQGTSDPYFVGLYFTKVKMGSPPREFNVQIDTGSDTLWVNCNRCSNCPQSSGLGLLSIDPAAFGTSNDRGTIVDSGTTLAYLVQEAYDPFVNAITTIVSQFARPIISKGNQCYLVPTNLGDIFPLVSLNFMGGASMVLKPEQYLMHYGFLDGAAMWCMGFQKVQQGFTILGDLVLKDKIFVYDLANERIGWTNYDCSLSVNVSVTATKSKDQYINEGQLSVSSSLMIGHVYKLLPVSIAVLLVHMIISIVSPIL